MFDIVEVEFKGHRKLHAKNPEQFPFEIADPAIVAVERGQDLGRITHLDWRPGTSSEEQPSLVIVRRATADDLRVAMQNRRREKDAREIALQKIIQHKLEMKLVDIELQWDGRKMTFYFTADGRVDFRELVKDLASTFRTRIDLRQIGARDETKRTGGYGVCGCSLCCSTFLDEFKPITTQMPRDQFLPLNPSKLSGVCGRLKCCLRYELDAYRDFQRQCPKLGHPVQDGVKGRGCVEKLDLIREQIHLRFESGDTERLAPAEFQEISDWNSEMTRADFIHLNLQSAAPVPPPPRDEEPVAPDTTEVKAGERVTLLAGGGIGLSAGEDGEEIQAGTDLSVPARQGASKKKRKRRRSHRKGDKNVPSGSDSNAPSTDD
ncbi:hypothetical protein KKH27_05400 [bacterium]|nr:hypothetical protein [bacterium]MBU1984446.1 hypothetical protein [bacterium]